VAIWPIACAAEPLLRFNPRRCGYRGYKDRSGGVKLDGV
jgi:hypothetical protein